ncbi:hypothetical protein CEP54_015602 [Fusarium duplospermum]|uniref:Protein kinase domain-containing protein n=1 Tax=Fusarium duplospermum TaxID=1325734 RepID=A0A428NMU0_9HYPO|nr:hypothetical protein CEP54_015602 [Fusarium duplospermum]
MKSSSSAQRPQASISGLRDPKTEYANSSSHALTPPSTQHGQSPYTATEQEPQSFGPQSPYPWPGDYHPSPSEARKRRIEEPSDSLMADTGHISDSQYAHGASFSLGVRGTSIANDFSGLGKLPHLTPTKTLSIVSDAGNQQYKDNKANKERESYRGNSRDIVLAPSVSTGPGPDRASPSRTSHRSKFQLQRELRMACQEIKSPMHNGQKTYFLPKAKLDELVNEASVTRQLAAQLPSGSHSDYIQLESVAKAVCTEEEVKLDDGKLKTRSYRQIFAILVFIGESASIRLFMKHRVSDLDLPLIEDSAPGDEYWNELYRGNADGEAQGEPLECTQEWSPENKKRFCECQWMMLAPFFSLGAYNHVKHYKLKDQHLLPFFQEQQQFSSPESMRSQSTERGGGFSQVFLVWIHPDHHNFHDCGPDPRRGFAIKRLLKTDEKSFKKEVDMLKKFSGDGSHDHVVSVLATYEQFGTYHLIFHWADGDLFRYWNQICRNPTFDYSTVLWMAKQLYGLADGLLRFHRHYTDPNQNSSDRMEDRNGDEAVRPTKRTRFIVAEPPPTRAARSYESGHGGKKERYGRHGDLKPENILLFPSPKDNPGVLKISDLGQAELHSTCSKTRRESRGVNTLTYRPPESDVEPHLISRASDIWSLGCIFLEFVTWMLDGMEAVDKFKQQRMSSDLYLLQMDSDTFYQLERIDNLQHVGAKLKDSHINMLRSRPNCTEYFKYVLDLISEGMLVIDGSLHGGRKDCGRIRSGLKEAYEKCQNERLYAVGV